MPLFNEEENAEPLVRGIAQSVRPLELPFEIVIVDDGSEDESAAVLARWMGRDPRVRSVHHGTNRGYGAALRAGLREARGDRVFFSDADLQFDLREIAHLLAQADAQDVDIVAPRLDEIYGHYVGEGRPS